jgi:hypothetical protein
MRASRFVNIALRSICFMGIVPGFVLAILMAEQATFFGKMSDSILNLKNSSGMVNECREGYSSKN